MEQVAVRVGKGLIDKTVSDYGSGLTEKEYPEIAWSTYGLPVTNEIAVVTELGALKLRMTHLSAVLYRATIHRIFGTDFAELRESAK